MRPGGYTEPLVLEYSLQVEVVSGGTVLTTSAVIFACGAIAAIAQQGCRCPDTESEFQVPSRVQVVPRCSNQTNKHALWERMRERLQDRTNATKNKTTIRAAIEGMAAE